MKRNSLALTILEVLLTRESVLKKLIPQDYAVLVQSLCSGTCYIGL